MIVWKVKIDFLLNETPYMYPYFKGKKSNIALLGDILIIME